MHPPGLLPEPLHAGMLSPEEESRADTSACAPEMETRVSEGAGSSVDVETGVGLVLCLCARPLTEPHGKSKDTHHRPGGGDHGDARRLVTTASRFRQRSERLGREVGLIGLLSTGSVWSELRLVGCRILLTMASREPPGPTALSGARDTSQGLQQGIGDQDIRGGGVSRGCMSPLP